MAKKRKSTLSKTMTKTAFENGYFYTPELQAFAETIGIPSSKKLRKDELEKAILHFLATGDTKSPTKRSLSKSGIKDVDLGLKLALPIINYTSNRATKDFILKEARKLVPDLKRRSGVSYRLNRWREGELAKGKRITYRDLIAEYIRLNQGEEPFAHIPHGRYINFVADFLANEKDVTRKDAVRAWNRLKTMDAPKTYRGWLKARSNAKKKPSQA